jgi:hypothetical protein
VGLKGGFFTVVVFIALQPAMISKLDLVALLGCGRDWRWRVFALEDIAALS